MSQVLLRSTLQERSLARVLFVLFRKSATATIRIDDTWRLYVRNGAPVDGDVPGAGDTLGRVLFELGIISSEAYNSSLAELAKGGRLHGEILRASKALDDAGLARGLGQQVLRKFIRAMALEKGALEVVVEEHGRGTRHDTARVDPRLVIHQGVRRGYSPKRVERDLAVLTGKMVRLNPAVELGEYGFSGEDRAMIALLGSGFQSVDELTAAAGRQATSALMIAYCLMVTEALEVREQRDVSEAERPPATMLTEAPAARAEATVRRALGPEAEAIRERIRIKAAAVDQSGDDLFAVLELAEGASPAEVKRAYFALAKTFHPDRLLAQGLDDLQADAARVLARGNEAFATLSDPKRRAEWVANRGAGDLRAKQEAEDAEAQRILTAEFCSEKAEILLKRRDFAGAVTEAQQAVTLAPKEGRYQAVLVWATWCATLEGDRPPLLAKTRRTLENAVKDEPKFANGFFWLAQVARAAGDDAAAQRAYLKAHELDPRNLDAEREVRLYNMRKQKGRGA